jgi:hypothetical protein
MKYMIWRSKRYGKHEKRRKTGKIRWKASWEDKEKLKDLLNL